MFSFRIVVRAAAAAAVAAALSAPAFAATVTKINDDALAPLRGSVVEKKLRLDKLPLYDSKRSVVDLEEFQVWAPGAKVIIHGDNGVVLRKEDPPPMRFFRGTVNNNPQSFAYFSIDQTTGKIEGLIDTGDKQLAIASARRAIHATPRQRDVVASEPLDYFMTEVTANDEAPEKTWTCLLDDSRIVTGNRPLHATGANGRPVTSQGITGTQSYSITVEVETDYELYHIGAGDNSTTATNYVTNLSAAVSTIYNRDLHTNVVQANVNIYTSISDPWNAIDPSTGLNELGDYYHSVSKPAGRTTSEVVMLSGKAIGGGIAWEGIVCGTDFSQGGHWGGPYAWCGGIGNLGGTGFGSTAGNTTPPYGMPSGTQNYWPLAEYTHEMGHNLAGHHTHCVATTDAERIASGFTDGSPTTSASDFVDHCYAHETNPGCFAGSTDYVSGSAGTFKGTIMSYCHNISPQPLSSRFTFGQPVEASHHELDDYMLSPTGPGANGGGLNIVTGVGSFTISAISGSSTAAPNSTGNTASFTAAGATTFAWQITNGTITAGQGTNSITYTAGSSGTVTLRATAYNSTMCGVTDTKAVVIGAVIAAPTGVNAIATTPTNIHVTWNSVTGASNYQVYRNDGMTGYQPTGSPTSSLNFDDTVTTNKSYLYVVQAIDAGSNHSSNSAPDFATAIIFTNNLTGAVIKALDLTELRTAVAAMRVLANQGSTTFANPTITPGVTVINAVDITELRTFLNNARTTMGFGTVTFSRPITQQSTTVAAVDFTEIRGGVQ